MFGAIVIASLSMRNKHLLTLDVNFGIVYAIKMKKDVTETLMLEWGLLSYSLSGSVKICCMQQEINVLKQTLLEVAEEVIEDDSITNMHKAA